MYCHFWADRLDFRTWKKPNSLCATVEQLVLALHSSTLSVTTVHLSVEKRGVAVAGGVVDRSIVPNRKNSILVKFRLKVKIECTQVLAVLRTKIRQSEKKILFK